ncbi:MAG: hypothetical protein SFX73_03045 [Kofleriaceae bacterium]|nr:hypothetical protein [Kofleriaceae bacterium]
MAPGSAGSSVASSRTRARPTTSCNTPGSPGPGIHPIDVGPEHAGPYAVFVGFFGGIAPSWTNLPLDARLDEARVGNWDAGRFRLGTVELR